jgi:hypothetical protein
MQTGDLAAGRLQDERDRLGLDLIGPEELTIV